MGGGFQGNFEGFEDAGAQGGGAKSRGQAGRDLRYDLEIEFEEAAFGLEKEIEIARRLTCDTCSGSGAKKGSTPENCSQCEGSGQVRSQQGFFTISRACGACNGEGKQIKNPCDKCRGTGLNSSKSKIKVTIPAGIDHGQRLKLRGEGEAGVRGGPAGDLYVVVIVKEHPTFIRHDADIVCTVPISYSTASLGAEIQVPTLEGPIGMKVPPGTLSGKNFRIKNRGVQVLGTNRRGDQHVKVVIKVPKKMSAEHRKALEDLKKFDKEFEKETDESGIFGKFKDMFQ
ncbi:UNVERIFIED_CONTAM: hypothetical protein GTU68_067162 [Idotea baltica]|nr:hypothetical protein [Idotea baltica]